MISPTCSKVKNSTRNFFSLLLGPHLIIFAFSPPSSALHFHFLFNLFSLTHSSKIISSTMAVAFLLLLFSLFSLSSSEAKVIPRFPSKLSASDSPNTNHQPFKTKYFSQILDHFNFNPQSYQTFQQKYLINDSFWGGATNNSPIFVYTGNEGDINWFAQNTGLMFDIAPHFKALLVFLEVTLLLHF